MNRREFMCLAVGLFAGSMLQPPQPVVRLPTRPRIGPLPTATPAMPSELAYLDSLSCPPLQLSVVYRVPPGEVKFW